ncbi:MAG: PLP-dependent aminotransferase family protein [Spirochaetia bacterium]|nr:PLP-dependent aminotransferase family protein [Spirochaetia bacterium]
MRKHRTKDRLRYQEIADIVTGQIHGNLMPGEKLPSVRRLSRQEKVSVTTVLHAYEILENQGLITSKSGSGYYVRRKPGQNLPEPSVIQPPASPSFVNIDRTVLQILGNIRQKNLISFGAALPSSELLPNHSLNKITAKLSRQKDNALIQYENPFGNFNLKRQLSRYSADWGRHLSPDEFTITAGCTEALSLSLRASVRSGGVVAVESPVYYGILMILAGLGFKALEIPSNPSGGPSISTLEKLFKQKNIDALLLTSNFSNPLGSLISDEDKEKIADLSGRHKIPIIEDDIYGDLYFKGKRPVTIHSFDKKGMVLLCSSFSKSIAPGFRVGYAVPGRFEDEFRKIKFMSTGSTTTMSQLILAEYLSGGGYDRHMQNLRKSFHDQILTGGNLIENYFPEGTRISRPQGGMVLWVELPKDKDSYKLYLRALKENISIVPGYIFSSSKNYKNCFRLSCGFPWTEQNRNALKRLGEIAAERL